jgi:hypothetical protein
VRRFLYKAADGIGGAARSADTIGGFLQQEKPA